jgi:hypothetical protein
MASSICACPTNGGTAEAEDDTSHTRGARAAHGGGSAGQSLGLQARHDGGDVGEITCRDGGGGGQEAGAYTRPLFSST